MHWENENRFYFALMVSVLLMRWRLLASINTTVTLSSCREGKVQQGTFGTQRKDDGLDRRAEIFDTMSEILFILQEGCDKGSELEVRGFVWASDTHSNTHILACQRAPDNAWDFCDDVLSAPGTLWLDFTPDYGAIQDKDKGRFSLFVTLSRNPSLSMVR